MSLMTDKAWKICQRNGGIWGEYSRYPVAAWQLECRNNETRRGYWNWVVSQIEQQEMEEQK